MKKVCLILLITLVLGLAGCGGDREIRDRYEEGCALLAEGSFDQAREAFEEVAAGGEYVAEAYRGIGLAQLYTNRYAEACIAFERSLLNSDGKSVSFNRDVSLYLAFSRTHHAESEKAMEIYDALIARDENDTEVLYLRGRARMEAGDENGAREDFDRAAEGSQDYNLFLNIYQVYEGLGKNADGSAYLEKALEIVNQNEEDHYKKGLVSYYLQNYDDARDELITAIREDPEDDQSILLLGRVYLRMDDVADARAMFREHIRDSEIAASAYNGLALCEMAEGDYDRALEYVNAGLGFEDEEAARSLKYNEIVIYENLAQWDIARVKAAAYVLLYPTDENGQREYEFLKSR